ncbi:uncharacterized protein LOC142558196 [Dermacentor variabilis]|uniref:uncharacterized protein LOC142558196 n=1 Tax=Dermacentor variabilis TaxID=34621 RepID=UPI003F5C34D3
MDGGKVGLSVSTRAQPGETSDRRREANSLPEDGAGPSSQDRVAADVEAQRQKPATDDAGETSKEREPPAQRAPIGSKRQSRDGPRGAPSRRKVRLQEHIPKSQVVDYEELDTRRVKLSCFAKGVRKEDVVPDYCLGAVETKHLTKGDILIHVFAVYDCLEMAVVAAGALDGAVIKGSPIKATYMAERWNDPGTRPKVSSHTLDVWNVPSEFLNKEKLAAVFKTGDVIKVSSTGPCKVRFSSPSELIGAVKDPACRTLAGQNLKFAMAIDSVESKNRARANAKRNARAAKRPKKSAKPGTSRPKSSGQNKKARKK